MTRILYFSKDYSPHDHRFLSALSETEHEVYYLKLEKNLRQIEDRPVPSNIEQILWAGGQGPFRWRDLPRLVLDLKRVVHEIKPDLIHAGPIQTCAFIAALSGFRPILTMSWGFDLMQDAERNWRMKQITRYVLRNSTFFTSDAQVTRDKAVAYGMNPDRTAVFPWGVDLKHFRPQRLVPGRKAPVAKNRKPEIGNRKSFTLFCNRSWEPRYGVDVLARAFVKVVQKRKDAGLLLLSGGSQGNVIRSILLNGGALDRVHFGGQVSQTDLPRWYHMADLYISPSHVDGSSVSLMEALACGLPALVSDIPANKEWVSEGVNGWLFPDGDADALAEKILALIAQRKELPKIGRAARRSARERADWEKNFAKLIEAYEQTIQLDRRSK
ncbi:MAG: glycosyltransferase family 4 protein [Chloroflexi bacterium]|nr:glycosyltransferase family 4 protein [Chloroflexota bacterium]MBI3338573.1 glycosyltransferase family 4 protein [Chloroflexota bacterium]